MLPPLLNISEIHRRLALIFPEGTPHRNYVIREMSARTIFVMLYIGALEGTSVWMAPKHVYRMGEGQASRWTDEERHSYAAAVERPGFAAPADRWFQDNTREPIRDETLRDGLVQVGCCGDAPWSADHLFEGALCAAEQACLSVRTRIARRRAASCDQRLARTTPLRRQSGAGAPAAAIDDGGPLQGTGNAAQR